MYCKEFCNLHKNSTYIALYCIETENLDWRLNVFTALVSSGAISSWVIWNQLGWLWGALIAISQIIQAIKPLIPYSERLKRLHILSADLSLLKISAEEDWYRISNGLTNASETMALYSELQRKIHHVIAKSFSNTTLPLNSRLDAIAVERSADYIVKRYT